MKLPLLQMSCRESLRAVGSAQILRACTLPAPGCLVIREKSGQLWISQSGQLLSHSLTQNWRGL